jgi:hypothetical protein
MTANTQLFSEEERGRVLLYPEYDFIPVVEPDPPFVRVPPLNDQFLTNHFTPVFETTTCPFCKSKVQRTVLGCRAWVPKMQSALKEWSVKTEEGDVTLYICPACSWWAVLQTALGRQVIKEKNYMSLIDLVSVHWAKMKSLDVAAATAPLESLRAHLAKSTDVNSNTSQSHLVDILQSCFREFYSCDIVQVGEAATDPYDTFVISAEKPLIVRVNRKKTADADDLQIIHDVLGVQVAGSEFNGLRVSHTKRISDNLEQTAMLPVILNEGITIPLQNYAPVLELVKSPVDASTKPWDTIWC